MRQFLTALMKEGVFSIVVLALLLVLIWGAAFYTRGESADWMNLPVLITLVVIGLWVALFVVQKMLAVRNALRIEKQLQMQAGGQLEGVSADKKAETEALRKKFNESLDALKKTKGGKSALYTLPWYVIIGPPGSGKTTALQESGLNFPAIQGGAKVRGIGGTRNCDWWFTEDGILLDTAGRYTTVAEDQEEWLSFLEMIRTSRKSKPINGAIVAVSVDDLFRSTQSELDQMAKDIRNRLDELSARLNAVFPVYLMFTKCDLVAGFVEFFEDYTKDERSQVWGFTMAYSLPEKQYTAIFDEQCDRMTENLRARQIELLGTERPAQKKQNIYLFPRQFELARAKMKDFVGQLFGAHAFQEAAILRGIYFTSGTQKGTPIDQLMMRLGEAMGMGGEPAGADERVEKKSYFIHNLFSRIMFPDKTLARSTSKVIRRRMAWRLALQLVSVALFGLVTFGAVSAFNDSRTTIREVEEAGAGLATVEDSAPLSDTRAHMEALTAADKLRVQLEAARQNSRGWSWGMDHSRRLFDAGANRYIDTLKPLLIAPTRVRVENELRDLLAKHDARTEDDWQNLLDVWRVYAMQAGQIPPDAVLIATVLKRNQRWTGPLESDHANSIEQLAGHQLNFYADLIVLAHTNTLRYPWFTTFDADLMRRCRESLRGDYWVRNEVDSVVRYTSRQMARPLTIDDLAPGQQNLLRLPDSAKEDPNLPYLNAFTQNAWNSVAVSVMDERADKLARLFRDLGVEDTKEQILDDMHRVFEEKQQLVWDRFLDVIELNPSGFNSVENARNSLSVLTSKDDTPLKPLIQNVWKHRALRLSATRQVPQIAADEPLQKALDALRSAFSAYDTYYTSTDQGSRVRSHVPGGKLLGDLAQSLTEARGGVTSAIGSRTHTAGLLLRVLRGGVDGLRADATSEMNAVWKAQVADVWRDNFEGRFPFDPEAERGAPLARFSEFFNPADGTFWKFDKQFASLSNLRFAGDRLFAPTPEYDVMKRQFERVRDACFHEAEDRRLRIVFSVRLSTPDTLFKRTQLFIGRVNGQPKIVDFPRLTPEPVILTQGETGVTTGAYLRLDWKEEQPTLDVTNDLRDDEWGFFRLIQASQSAMKVEGASPPESYIVWSAPLPGAEGRVRLDASITREKGVEVFTKGFFSGLKPVEGVMH